MILTIEPKGEKGRAFGAENVPWSEADQPHDFITCQSARSVHV